MIYQGDLLFCSGTSGISKEIKKVTGSEYSHVGLLFTYETNGQRLTYVIEAISPRIAVIPLEQYFTNYQQSGKPYPGKLFLGRIHGGLSLQHSRDIHSAAVRQIGKEYDTASIIKQAFNHFFGTALTDKDNHRLICSELVALCYKNAGIELKKDKHGYHTPGSIARDERMVIAQLKDYCVSGETAAKQEQSGFARCVDVAFVAEEFVSRGDAEERRGVQYV